MSVRKKATDARTVPAPGCGSILGDAVGLKEGLTFEAIFPAATVPTGLKIHDPPDDDPYFNVRISYRDIAGDVFQYIPASQMDKVGTHRLLIEVQLVTDRYDRRKVANVLASSIQRYLRSRSTIAGRMNEPGTWNIDTSKKQISDDYACGRPKKSTYAIVFPTKRRKTALDQIDLRLVAKRLFSRLQRESLRDRDILQGVSFQIYDDMYTYTIGPGKGEVGDYDITLKVERDDDLTLTDQDPTANDQRVPILTAAAVAGADDESDDGLVLEDNDEGSDADEQEEDGGSDDDSSSGDDEEGDNEEGGPDFDAEFDDMMRGPGAGP